MKSWVISSRRRSDGAHHSSQTPQISLYLSSTLIQQNNSPKSLSFTLSHLLLLSIFHFTMVCGELRHTLYVSAGFVPVCVWNQNREGQTGKWKKEQIMYITGLFTCFQLHHFLSQNQTLHNRRHDKLWHHKHQTRQGEMKRSSREEDWLKDDRQTAVSMEITPTIDHDNSLCFQ